MISQETRKPSVLKVTLNQVPLLDASIADQPDARLRLGFALSAAEGSRSFTAIYAEIEPGNMLPRHCEQFDELVFVIEGTLEVTAGQETAQATAGEIVQLPAMVPHSARNVGSGTARALLMQPNGTVTAVFDKPIDPIGSKILGTPDWMVAAGIIPAPEPAAV
jgi:quercetin dioxygenase-like cupin family protein